MRVSMSLHCVRVSPILALLMATVAVAVPPPGATMADGRKISSDPSSARPITLESTNADGSAAGVDSFGVTLLSHIPISDFGGASSSVNDCWGYVSPSGREYALLGGSQGVAIADVTNPSAPVVLTEIAHPGSTWSDMKTFDEYAYVVNENGGGMQILDLRLIDQGIVTQAPANPHEFNSAHNIALNPESGFAYPCGTNPIFGFIAYDLSDPANPQTDPSWIWMDEYVHDVHFVNYGECPYAGRSGPCEIAFASCGGAGLRIIDVTDKANMTTIASRIYPGLNYCHQSWTTEDGKFLLLGDEGDEISVGVPTTTYVWDVQDLANPTLASTVTNGHFAVDHNLYVRGDFMFAANYASGLRIFDVSDPPNAFEVGWYDTPSQAIVWYVGAWGVYPFLPSGTILVSNMQDGLYIFDVAQTTGCFIDSNCDDSNSCTTDTCEPDGSCTNVDVAADTACDDGDNCTTNGTCNASGTCLSTQVSSISCADDTDCGIYTCGGSGFCTCEQCVDVVAPVNDAPEMTQNRYLTVVPTNAGTPTAIEVVFSDLARPYDVYNGMSLWVTAPSEVSEGGAAVDPVPEFGKFMGATLSCTPHFMDWGSLGSVSIHHALIVPDSMYRVRAISQGCLVAGVERYSPTVRVATSRFGDVVGNLVDVPPGPPDGNVVIADALAIIASFANVPGSARKARTDLEPGNPDLLINVSDILVGLSAFSGVPFPFTPPTGPPPCP